MKTLFNLKILLFCSLLLGFYACSSKKHSQNTDTYAIRSNVDLGNDFNSKEEDNDIAGSEIGNGSKEHLEPEGFDLFCDTSNVGTANCEVTGQDLSKISNIKWILYYKLPDSSFNEREIESTENSASINLPKDAEEILVKSVIFTEDSQNPNEIENVALSTNSSKPDSENIAGNPSREGDSNEEEIKQEEYYFSLDYNAQDRFGNTNNAVKFPDFGNISFPIAEIVDSISGFSLSAWIKIDLEFNKKMQK